MMPQMQPHSATTEGEVERYQRELNEARDRIASLEKDGRLTRYKAVISDLRRDYQLDEAEELAECQNQTQEQFEKHVKKIRERYQKLPRDPNGPLRLADLDSPMEGDQPAFTKADMDAALKYQAQHPGTEWRAAAEHVVKEKKAGGVARGA